MASYLSSLDPACVTCLFFFNDTATTEIYTYGHTLSLHDALPILASTVRKAARSTRCSTPSSPTKGSRMFSSASPTATSSAASSSRCRSEEHTSELQSLMRISYAVFCLKKKKRRDELPQLPLH